MIGSRTSIASPMHTRYMYNDVLYARRFATAFSIYALSVDRFTIFFLFVSFYHFFVFNNREQSRYEDLIFSLFFFIFRTEKKNIRNSKEGGRGKGKFKSRND